MRDFRFIQERLDGFGARGTCEQAGFSVLIEGPDGIANRLTGTRQVLCDLGGWLSGRAGQQDLASSERESVCGTQTRFQGKALVGRDIANEKRWFHAKSIPPRGYISQCLCRKCTRTGCVRAPFQLLAVAGENDLAVTCHVPGNERLRDSSVDACRGFQICQITRHSIYVT